MFEIFKGKKVLVTGHSGFKGSWLALWLKKLGAEVVGYGHGPSSQPNHYTLLGGLSMRGLHMELLDHGLLLSCVKNFQPDIVFHLAAKAIVARTFTEPRETFENNVMGAVNLLEACRLTPSVKGVVCITTDKVYNDQNWRWGYRENDGLDGIDPYSASKVCVEHVVHSYRDAFGLKIATARAGNVIGGGDWSYKRLIPDIVRAAAAGEPVVIHTPDATRPWQHVLDALQGYLLLGEKILQGESVNSAWNFGPEREMKVLNILHIAQDVWPKVEFVVDETQTHPFMVYLLKLDSTKSLNELNWKPTWGMERAVYETIMWYRQYYEHGLIESERDINTYTSEMEAVHGL